MPGPGACVRLLFRCGSLLFTVNYFFRMTSGKSLRVEVRIAPARSKILGIEPCGDAFVMRTNAAGPGDALKCDALVVRGCLWLAA